MEEKEKGRNEMREKSVIYEGLEVFIMTAGRLMFKNENINKSFISLRAIFRKEEKKCPHDL